jgi:hypothetical protein
MTIISVVGVLRIIFKPIFTVMHAVADATPSQTDNQVVDSIENHKITKGLLFVLDWIASIKIK